MTLFKIVDEISWNIMALRGFDVLSSQNDEKHLNKLITGINYMVVINAVTANFYLNYVRFQYLTWKLDVL